MDLTKVYRSVEYGPAFESDSKANIWLEKHSRRFGNFIDGQFKKPKNLFETINPSSAEKIANISEADSKDLELAIKSAKKASKELSILKALEER